MTQRFTGTDGYVAAPDLMLGVNAAVTLARPLRIPARLGGRRSAVAIAPWTLGVLARE